MTPNPFQLARLEQGFVLLCVALSALCLYAPCRWRFRYIPPPNTDTVRRFLPYLYLLFALTLPVQLFKNYRYFEYVQQHGGYLAIFLNHAALAATVPFLVRVIPLVSFPVFVAIYVFERRKWLMILATFLYFATASVILLLGSRMGVFSLLLALWWVSRIKSVRKPRILPLIAIVLSLLLVADYVRQLRESPDSSAEGMLSPLQVLSLQGASLNVTEVAIHFRSHFSPYAGSYLLRELQNAFVPNDTTHYFRGQALGFDITVLLLPAMFEQGYGVASSYIAEAYVLGGLAGVVVVSLLISFGLQLVYRLSASPISLLLVAMVLPDILLMPRGALLDWASVFTKNLISIALLWVGWRIYRLLFSLRGIPPDSARATAFPARA